MTRSMQADVRELPQRARRGRLKLYLGFAAGVGKTYRMLEDALLLKERGIDVAIGFAEPHGRGDVEALHRGLEVVPRRRVQYRGVAVEEMDLEAVLARRPAVAIVDDIAHTNAPGSRHRRRYQDVLSLCEAGIDVLCAFNVQHLESLKDLVERATDGRIRETVPDTFLRQADEVIALDLAVEDLLDRLRAGKIYPPEKIGWALEHVFQPKSLTTLRELVLREVAESVERSAARGRESDGRQVRAAAGRVMVCMASYSPRAQSLLRRGSRMAGRLSTDWYVVYVETPAEAPDRIDAAAERHLHENIAMARELGAEVIRLRGREPVDALLEFARSREVGHIIIGRSHAPWWKRVLGLDVCRKMVNRAYDIDLHIVAFHEEDLR